VQNPANSAEKAPVSVSPLAGVQAWAVAALCLIVAFGVRSALNLVWGERYPFVIFFGAVFVVIQLADTRLSIITIIAGFLLGDWFFVRPNHSLHISDPATLRTAAVYFLLSFIMLYFSARARKALSRERDAREQLRQHALALGESQARFQHLFENSPAATWVEDWTALKKWLEELRSQGVADLRAHLEANPGQIRRALELIRVVDVNGAAARQAGASSRAELKAGLSKLFNDDTCQDYITELVALWQDKSHIEYEARGQRLDGQRLDLIIGIDVPRKSAGQKQDFANVIVTAINITERKKTEHDREQLVQQLQTALAEVKTLSGLLPICAHCKKIRDDQGYWNQIEFYIREHSNVNFTHSVCPECSRQFYPTLFSEEG
jgi:PAS domain-containing protein